MTLPALFQTEYVAAHPRGTPRYLVFSCLQWLGPNFEYVLEASRQQFALVYNHHVDQRLLDAIEFAYVRGVLAPVKLIAQHDQNIYLILDKYTATATQDDLQEFWKDLHLHYPTCNYVVEITNEANVSDGNSSYPFLEFATEILASVEFRRIHYNFPRMGPVDPDTFLPNEMWESFDSEEDNL